MKVSLLRPLINEKSMGLSKEGFYTFEIGKGISKKMVEKTVESLFKVDVLSVTTLNLPRKSKMQRTRKGFFTVAGMKKAIVKVKKGQKIPIFESLAEDQDKEEVKVKTIEGEPLTTIQEKKSLLKGTKVKIEKEADRFEETKETKQKRGKLATNT